MSGVEWGVWVWAATTAIHTAIHSCHYNSTSSPAHLPPVRGWFTSSRRSSDSLTLSCSCHYTPPCMPYIVYSPWPAAATAWRARRALRRGTRPETTRRAAGRLRCRARPSAAPCSLCPSIAARPRTSRGSGGGRGGPGVQREGKKGGERGDVLKEEGCGWQCFELGVRDDCSSVGFTG